MSLINLRHGIFLPPFHPMEENPTACLDRDLELSRVAGLLHTRRNPVRAAAPPV